MQETADNRRVPRARALVPSVGRVPAVRRAGLPAVARMQLVPLVRRSVAIAAVGLAAEYALRVLANRALSPRAAEPVAPRAVAAAGSAMRTVIFEMTIIERVRRTR